MEGLRSPVVEVPRVTKHGEAGREHLSPRGSLLEPLQPEFDCIEKISA